MIFLTFFIEYLTVLNFVLERYAQQNMADFRQRPNSLLVTVFILDIVTVVLNTKA
jgi:hypothetical protein